MTNQEKLRLYLRDELKMPERLINYEMAQMSAHPDILNEFCEYLHYKKFPEQAIKQSGFTTEILYKKHKKLFKTVYAAYNYLIYLREFPDKALQMLERGLPIK